MKKKLGLLLCLTLAIILSIAIPLLATNINRSYETGHREYVNENTVICAIEELQDLVLTLFAERQMISALTSDVDFRSYDNLHLHPDFDEYMLDGRFALLRELNCLFIEAKAIQNRARGNTAEAQHAFIFSSFSGPNKISMCDTFYISFVCEEYLPLVYFIIEFLGIESDMLETSVSPAFVVWPSAQYEHSFLPYEYFFLPSSSLYDYNIVNEALEYEIEAYGVEPRMITVPMGTRLARRVTGGWVTMGTLGHPLTTGGSFAYGTNHDEVPRGAYVYTATIRDGRLIGVGSRIGSVDWPVFVPAAGLDLSLIDLLPSHRVSNQVTGTSWFINNFFGVADQGPSVDLLVSRDGTLTRLTGSVRSLSRDVTLEITPGRIVTMRTMLIVHIPGAGPGDSGAALIQRMNPNTNAVGTLVGGNERTNEVFFSRAQAYINIVPR